MWSFGSVENVKVKFVNNKDAGINFPASFFYLTIWLNFFYLNVFFASLRFLCVSALLLRVFAFPSRYSYLNATIGSRLLAFHAGYKPAIRPTIEQMMIPPPMIFQGIRKPVSIKEPTKFPMRTPKMIPTVAPIRLMIIDSYKN